MSIDFNSLTPAQQQEILDGPALTPPPGVVPNFIDPPNQETLVHLLYSICLTIGTLFVFLRACSSWFCAKKAHMSDYIMLLSWARNHRFPLESQKRSRIQLTALCQCFYTAFVATVLHKVGIGYFVHQWNFRLRAVPEVFYFFTVATNLYIIAVMLIKTAILLEWLRIFLPRRQHNYFYWITTILLWVNGLFYFSGIIALNLTCIPHEKIWNRFIPGHCLEGHALDITSAAINFAIDLVVLVLPQKVIWALHMSFRKRLGVSAVFMVGCLACFAAAYRLAVTVDYARSEDATYTFCMVGIWALIETTCGLVVLCIPALPKAAEHLGATRLITAMNHWVVKLPSKAYADYPSIAKALAGVNRKPKQHNEWGQVNTSSTASENGLIFADIENDDLEIAG